MTKIRRYFALQRGSDWAEFLDDLSKGDGAMFDDADMIAFANDQGARARKMFAAVVLAALDDAIADEKKYGNGVEGIARWARSRDGVQVLTCAGIEPNERSVQGLVEFVRRGIRTSVALRGERGEDAEGDLKLAA